VVFTRLPVILPVPLLPAVPVMVAVLFLVQLLVVVLNPPEKTMAVNAEPEQITCEAGVATLLIEPICKVATGSTEQKSTGWSLYTSR
jgi:hypothetical protein